MPYLGNRRYLTITLILMVLTVFVIGAVLVVRVADVHAAATKRCEPVDTAHSFVYNCWLAHAESFSLIGKHTGTYRFEWSVSCHGTTIGRSQTFKPNIVNVYLVYVGVLSKSGRERAAYELFYNSSTPCRVKVAGKRLSDHGWFLGGLAINVDHPAGVRA